MKKVLNITGARQLSKNEQKNVTGGRSCCTTCCDPILECCTIRVPDNQGCGPVGCTYLYPSEWIACGGSTNPDGSTHCV